MRWAGTPHDNCALYFCFILGRTRSTTATRQWRSRWRMKELPMLVSLLGLFNWNCAGSCTVCVASLVLQGSFHPTQPHSHTQKRKHGRSLTVMYWTTIFNVMLKTQLSRANDSELSRTGSLIIAGTFHSPNYNYYYNEFLQQIESN